MKTITIYRDDFKKSAEADFFEDLLSSLDIPKNIWDDVDHVELSVENWILQQR
jgi:hypothetical protein